jgi:hypothetical protein
MKKMLIFLMAMLIATSASAITNPDPDIMGYYFDLDADYDCVDGITPYSANLLFLILTNPTSDAIYGFEAGYTMEGEGMVLSVEFANPQVINVGTNDNIIAGFGEPTLTVPATLILTLNVMYMDPGYGALMIFLHGTTPSSLDPLYPTLLLEGGVLQSVGVNNFGWATAQFNNCVMATETQSFDSLKSLYR